MKPSLKTTFVFSFRLFWISAMRIYRTIQFKNLLVKHIDHALTKELSKQYPDLHNKLAVIDDRNLTALTIGFTKPIMIISKQLIIRFSKPVLQAILLHEVHHLKKRDPLKKLIIGIIQEIVFFVPLIKGFTNYYLTNTELMADRYAIQTMGTSEPLSSAILKMVKMNGTKTHASVTSPFIESAIHYRNQQILDDEATVCVSVISFKSIGISFLALSVNLILFISCVNSQFVFHEYLF